jgi:multidrug resistance efflux pump
VTARVDETAIRDIRPGQRVDITVDAYPRDMLAGYVWQVRNATSAEFSPSPEDNATGVFDKVAQVIPVKIAVPDRGDSTLVPGMNVTVKIHKD